MALWAIITLAVYAIGLVTFILSILSEAPKHGVTPNITHFVVAFLWPIWGLWYLFSIAKEKLRGNRI